MAGARNRKAGLSGLFCWALHMAALNMAALGATPALAADASTTLKIEGASVAEDAQTHKLELDIVVRPAAREALRHFSQAHIGDKIALRIDGKTLITTVIREPALGGTMHVAGSSEDDMRAVLSQVSSGRAEIEFAVLPH